MYYNLIVSANKEQWERSNTPFPSSRILEHTHEHIKQAFNLEGSFQSCAPKYPALLMCESPTEQTAKIAKIYSITKTDTEYIIDFKVLSDFKISNNELEERAFQFDIDPFEFHRTHWAIKNIDLLATLDRLSLASDGQIKKLSQEFPDLTTPGVSEDNEDTSISVFISYSHKDKSFLERISVHLKPLERRLSLNVWDDQKLNAGDDWRGEIRSEIEKCSAAILVLSADFLASDFIANQELPPLLEAAKERGARIIPVIAKPCMFHEIDELASFQAINSPSTPLLAMSEAKAEETLVQLASTIRTLIPD